MSGKVGPRSKKRRRVCASKARKELLSRIDPLLEVAYHSPRHGNYKEPTTELFYLLLTVKSRIRDARPHLRMLKKQCGTWNNLPDIHPDSIKPAIEALGLGTKRSHLLVRVATQIRKDFGKVNLTGLKDLPHDDAISYLKSLPFVGEKVARCVALYSLGADISPMDANVTRVLSRIGVLPRNIGPKNAHDWMDGLIAVGAAYRLHVNLVAHGQECCKATSLFCEECPVSSLCRYVKTGY